MLAPVILFVYNRLYHTQRTIESLQKNELAVQSELFIWSDASKSKKDDELVKEVREYLKSIQGFKKISVVEQRKNLGLAKSIITGVTSVVNEYGKVIVLEDDLIVSPCFLNFMNETLENYKNINEVWHISGWNYPIELETDKDVYFYRVMDCWGWATWSDRWKFFEKNTDKLVDEFPKSEIKRFNLDGYIDHWRQVKLNKSGQIDTWAIYWYAIIFQKNGLCLNPTKSYVRNIGHDGSGVHCNISDYDDNLELNEKKHISFVLEVEEDKNIVEQIKLYLKKVNNSLYQRIVNKLKTKIIRLIA